MILTNRTYAPILFFCYNRHYLLDLVLRSLSRNSICSEIDFFVFCDGVKLGIDDSSVTEVRKRIRAVTGFKSISIFEANENKGLANSIIDAVSMVLQSFENVIVLEDDLVVSSNFIEYMNRSLEVYANNSSVLSISGYSKSMKLPTDFPYDNYFTRRSSSWGWATWRDRWEKIDWNVTDYAKFVKDKKARKAFNAMGSDLSGMLDKQMKGEINSWAIRFVYHQFKNELYTVFPTKSKVQNIGFGDGATHTREKFNRFETTLDTQNRSEFQFNPDVQLDPFFIKQFVKPYSLKERVKYKLLNKFFS